MILTDREIEIGLDNGHIIVEPRPDLTLALSSTALDLTLSNVFATWDTIRGSTLHPGAADYSFADVSRLQKRVQQSSSTLEPGNCVLAWTAEEVTLPEKSRLAARVEGKSSLARLGVGIHVTTQVIHSGFSGNIQLEMFNLGPHRIVLYAGMRVCQLVFEQTYGTPTKGYDGLFAGQRAAATL